MEKLMFFAGRAIRLLLTVFIAVVAGIWLYGHLNPVPIPVPFVPSSHGVCWHTFSRENPTGKWECHREYKNENVPFMPGIPSFGKPPTRIPVPQPPVPQPPAPSRKPNV